MLQGLILLLRIRLLRLIARRPEVVPQAMKKAPPIDVRAVLNRVYTLWAV